ncbi:hypothetical protein GJ496_006109 [Pomphorhynchus laevis]|nr:hypothetical protein GJ496_006109 [Pomphorhynchus laevis]
MGNSHYATISLCSTQRCVELAHAQMLLSSDVELSNSETSGYEKTGLHAINKIKSSSFSSRLFKQLCVENDEEFNSLLHHNEVRWLSKGCCLNRVLNIYSSVIEFFIERDDPIHLKLNESIVDIAYLTDLFNLFNEMNLKLQGNDLNLIKAKSVLAGFVNKILLYQQNLGRGI